MEKVSFQTHEAKRIQINQHISQGQLYPVNRPSVIECEIDFPVRSGMAPSTRVTIYENSVDKQAPRYLNNNTKKVAQLDVDVERVGMGRKLFSSKKKKMGGHWYYVFKSYIEATYESAWIGYTLKLKGMRLNFLTHCMLQWL